MITTTFNKIKMPRKKEGRPAIKFQNKLVKCMKIKMNILIELFSVNDFDCEGVNLRFLNVT